MAKTQNKYACPIEMSGSVQIAYGSPAHKKTYKSGMYQHAIDFKCPVGTPIKAAFDGTVIEVVSSFDKGGPEESFDRFANYIEIKHENNEYSQYEHLQKGGVLVKIGDRVKTGQTIGYSGATGWVAHLGPHLHFVVGKYGKTKEDFQSLDIVWKTRKQPSK